MDEKDIIKIFGYNLKNIMKNKNVTQEELAKRVDTSQVMISRYVRGETLPSVIVVRKMAKSLGCLIEDFFDENI